MIVPPGHCALTFLSWGWLVAICLIRPAARVDPDAGAAAGEVVLELAVVELAALDVFVLVD